MINRKSYNFGEILGCRFFSIINYRYLFYKKIYFSINRTVSTYISALIFFSFAFPVIRLIKVQEITPMAIPSEIL